jgi:hypothetical protein
MDKKINIYILCYNESILIPYTVNYYKSRFPTANITIYDNESIDQSVELAKSLNCEVISFSTNKINNVFIKRDIFDNCWKNVTEGWIITADMDEWLDIDENDLIYEEKQNTSILKIKGVDMLGSSNVINLDDIDLNNINIGVFNSCEDKNICFYVPKIKEMNFSVGCHSCKPKGIIKYSDKEYYNKHMNYLGIPYIINKNKYRFERSDEMRKQNLSTHYTIDQTKIINEYNKKLTNSINYTFIKYYNKNIQIHKNVINDILNNCYNKKMLVFGLGYDTQLWYNATNKNTYFIEHNEEYIKLNSDIDQKNIIFYPYDDISVKKSIQLLNNNAADDFLDKIDIPNKLLELAPFDIIIIDGPTGFNDDCPGRMIPMYWTKKYLSDKNTIMYIDDCNRLLEKKCINHFFIINKKFYFKERSGCMKVYN